MAIVTSNPEKRSTQSAEKPSEQPQPSQADYLKKTAGQPHQASQIRQAHQPYQTKAHSDVPQPNDAASPVAVESSSSGTHSSSTHSSSAHSSDARQLAHLHEKSPLLQPVFRSEPTFFTESDFTTPDLAQADFQDIPQQGHQQSPFAPVLNPAGIHPGFDTVAVPWHRKISKGLRADLPQLRYIFSLFIATRAALVLIGLVSHALLPKGYGKQIVWSSQPWLDIWGVWDSRWYMDIAQNGYSTATKLVDFPDQTNLPFFPLYPMMMRFVGYFTGGDPFIAGILISNGCLLVACYLLYKLAELEWGSAIARRSVKYIFLFPVSFILSGVFTESLYLCLSLLCFYLAKKRQWWLAGLCGGLLSATRTLGVLIAVPLLLEYFSSLNFRPRKIRFNILFLVLVPLGLLAFSYHNYQITGDYLFFKTNQAAWDRELMNPMTGFVQALSQGIGEPSFKKLLECAFFVGAFGLLSVFYKTIGISYWLLGMYSIWIPLSAGVASMPRFTLPIFPLFFILAILSRKGQWNLWLTVGFGALQGALMVLWCTGQGLVI